LSGERVTRAELIGSAGPRLKDTENPITLFMKLIEARLESNILENNEAACNANRKTNDVDG